MRQIKKADKPKYGPRNLNWSCEINEKTRESVIDFETHELVVVMSKLFWNKSFPSGLVLHNISLFRTFVIPTSRTRR